MRLVYYDEAVIERLAAAADLDDTMTVADGRESPWRLRTVDRERRCLGIKRTAGIIASAAPAAVDRLADPAQDETYFLRLAKGRVTFHVTNKARSSTTSRSPARTGA
jgi:hypothetical protein